MALKELVYVDYEQHHVVVMSDVVERLNSYRQLSGFSLEAAGVLIGERRGDHIVICDISEPGAGDFRERSRVNREGSHHQEKINIAFEASAGTLLYIGEWHTHPEDIPSPSLIDMKSWRSSLRAPSPMILLIIGRKDFWVGKKVAHDIHILKEKL